jgi:dihydrodipicolinate synthase/N-acetylneuraminate lyase
VAPIPDPARILWFARLFPEGIPTLWCPPLTHYDSSGAIDAARMAAHWAFMSPWVKGLLVPGSTGDGWELSEEESQYLLRLAADRVEHLKLHLLVGALRPVASEARQTIESTLAWLKSRAGNADTAACLQRTRVCGFAICPPRGQSLTQAELETALSSVLGSGLPIALYQLPQVTQNEMKPELVASLAHRFSSFILFKDTSGADRVAASGLDFRGTFLVRGAEGQYASALKNSGGPYDGFLLSTANSFCQQLCQIRDALSAGHSADAQRLSQRLTSLVEQMFRLVARVADGNPFANSGKAVDHFFAHGQQAARVAPPRLHTGRCLPVEIIRETELILRRHDLMPTRGYLG